MIYFVICASGVKSQAQGKWYSAAVHSNSVTDIGLSSIVSSIHKCVTNNKAECLLIVTEIVKNSHFFLTNRKFEW